MELGSQDDPSAPVILLTFLCILLLAQQMEASRPQWGLKSSHLKWCNSMQLHTSGWSACFTLRTNSYLLFIILTSSHVCARCYVRIQFARIACLGSILIAWNSCVSVRKLKVKAAMEKLQICTNTNSRTPPHKWLQLQCTYSVPVRTSSDIVMYFTVMASHNAQMYIRTTLSSPSFRDCPCHHVQYM